MCWMKKNPLLEDEQILVFMFTNEFTSVCRYRCKWVSDHTHTHTHARTHMLGFHVLWGLSIDVMVFILYKLYILSPYTAPIPKPNHHRRHSAILHFQKTSLSLIYKLVSSWGPKNVPTRTRILDIAIVVGTFCPHNVGYTWTTHTHTPYTHTHTHTHYYTVSHTHTRTCAHTRTHARTHACTHTHARTHTHTHEYIVIRFQ